LTPIADWATRANRRKTPDPLLTEALASYRAVDPSI
jgi:hypothetical protein